MSGTGEVQLRCKLTVILSSTLFHHDHLILARYLMGNYQAAVLFHCLLIAAFFSDHRVLRPFLCVAIKRNIHITRQTSLDLGSGVLFLNFLPTLKEGLFFLSVAF